MSERLLAGSILDEQIALEDRSIREGIDRYRNMAQGAIDRLDGASLKASERLIAHWFEPLSLVIKDEQAACKKGTSGPGRDRHGLFLLGVNHETIAYLTLNTIVSRCLHSPHGIGVQQLGYAIGSAVRAEVQEELLREANLSVWFKLKRSHAKSRRYNREASKAELEDGWMRASVFAVGVCLIRLASETCSMGDYYEEVFRPAIEAYSRYRGVRSYKYIRLTEEARRAIDDGHAHRSLLRPRYLPMIVPPYKWTERAQGGYIKIRTPLISKPTPPQKEALRSADLSKVYETIDSISSVPWRINRRVLAVMKALYEAGGDYAGLPSREPKVVPPEPQGDEAATKAWKKEAAITHRYNRNAMNARDALYRRLDLARDFADRDAIWFPHMLDFRGRAYPVPGTLNHQGDDFSRGLLEFARAVEPDRKWLLRHAANSWGYDKASWSARERWAEERTDLMRRWASDPMGDLGWTDAEKPWQFLAACMAIADPVAARHLPVQQDGSCNGLQHYTAMGRDENGARWVNMVAGDAPSDVYSEIARIARGRCERMIVDGHEKAELAAKVLPYINRKTVKQPVMTSVYGVTHIGAAEQITGQLEDAGFGRDQLDQSSRLLAKIVRESLGEALGWASSAMEWMRESARRIAKSGNLVAWTSPIDLPVVQPYRAGKRVHVLTSMKTLSYIYPHSGAVKVQKHVNSFAPNYIHSVDASHMARTANRSRAEGIDFSAVHDSYWSHAGNADRVARILREEFVAMHREPLIAKLHDELCDRFGVELDAPPARGSFDLGLVLDSPYFFS